MTMRVRTPAAMGAALAMAAAGTAGAQVDEAHVENLPPAQTDRWTQHTLPVVEVTGAMAQINARGEGRFAVTCEMGDRKGRIAYRLPVGVRDEIREGREMLDVTFTFDGPGNPRRREMTWDPEARMWVGPFGTDSPLADLMRKSMTMKISVDEFPAVESEFTLQGSWKAIDEMFRTCDI
jgi:hypothetical protein